jgi:tetratricopeptide (TPR) repeat protein
MSGPGEGPDHNPASQDPSGLRSRADALYLQGSRAIEQGSPSTAEAMLQQAVAIDPGHANAWYRLGEIAQIQGDLVSARQLYQRVLALQSAHVSAKRRLEQVAPVGPDAIEVPVLARQPGAGIAGPVSAVQQRFEQDSSRRPVLVLSFRVRARESGPSTAAPLSVEMRGRSLHGSIQNGDWIELPTDWRPGQALTDVLNLTTGEDVKVKDDSAASKLIGTTVRGVILIAFIVVMIIVVTSFVFVRLQ